MEKRSAGMPNGAYPYLPTSLLPYFSDSLGAYARLPRQLRRPAVLRDERLGVVAGHWIGDLHRGRLHQVRARLLERPADAVVQRQLAAAHGVDDDARRVRRVPDLE